MRMIKMEDFTDDYFCFEAFEDLAQVEQILLDVRDKKDSAIRNFSLKFDHVKVDEFKIGPHEIENAYSSVDKGLIKDIKTVVKNVEIFAGKQFEQYGNFEHEIEDLAQEIKEQTTDITKTGVILCPPATNLTTVFSVIKDSKIGLGAQNMHWEAQGAFTGENSADMIKSTGAEYIIIGHSERRQYFGETDETVNKKLKTALSNELKPIVCIGETLEERESEITKEVVKRQITGALNSISKEQMDVVILAYEPVWAIGTGKTATPDQAQDVHALTDLYDESVSSKTVIQYGGSVKPDNAAELLGQPDIDGALVGGACLKADSFAGIIKAAESL